LALNEAEQYQSVNLGQVEIGYASPGGDENGEDWMIDLSRIITANSFRQEIFNNYLAEIFNKGLGLEKECTE